MKKLLALLAVALAVGCASTGDVKTLQDQVTDLQDQIAQLKQSSSSKSEVDRLNSSLSTQTQTILKSNADVVAKVDQMDDRMQNLQGSIEQTNYRIDRLVQQVTQDERDLTDLKNGVRSATPSTPGQPGAIHDEVNVQAPANEAEDPLAIYQAAYRDYQKGNYELAIQGFSDYVKNNPNTDLADNAAYWLGESLFSQKKYPDAIKQFDVVINDYPKSDKVPAALLKKGYAYIEMGEKAQGIVQLQYVVHEHPRSSEAALAKQKLKALGIETK